MCGKEIFGQADRRTVDGGGTLPLDRPPRLLGDILSVFQRPEKVAHHSDMLAPSRVFFASLGVFALLTTETLNHPKPQSFKPYSSPVYASSHHALQCVAPFRKLVRSS